MTETAWRFYGEHSPNVALLTAHPDDETIFSAGLMLTYPGWNWHLVCLTAQNERRLREFATAAQALQDRGVNIASYHNLGKEDDGKPLSNAEFADWIASVEGLNLQPDIAITHNSMGEYGHPHHMSASRIAHTLWGNVWDVVFPGETAVGPQTVKDTINPIALTAEVRAAKRDIFTKAYGSQEVLWTALPAVMEYEFEQGPELFTA